jgi:uncharacterized protein YcnI
MPLGRFLDLKEGEPPMNVRHLLGYELQRLRVRSSALACCLALATSQSTGLAHVTISPSSLPAGADDELVFRCPDESAAATVKLVVQLPVDHPIASVKLRPIPGWRSSVTMRKLNVPISTDDGEVVAAVDTITWSGGRIDPGEYQDFAILAGPIPGGAKELTFKAVQTYSNGEVVRWIELRGPGQAEPAHPAPVLHIR